MHPFKGLKQPYHVPPETIQGLRPYIRMQIKAFTHIMASPLPGHHCKDQKTVFRASPFHKSNAPLHKHKNEIIHYYNTPKLTKQNKQYNIPKLIYSLYQKELNYYAIQLIISPYIL